MTDAAMTATSHRAGWLYWVAPALLFLLGLALYSINLDKPPRFDELYHILGARGFLEHGEPRIAEGVYDRGRYFTFVIALLFEAFGESVVVGRTFSVACMSLFAALLFIWTRREADAPAAWFATLAFLLSPFAVAIAQDIRFYAPFTLFFWIGAMAVYAAGTAVRLPPAKLAWLALVAVICLGIALYLQPLAVIGIGGLGLWLAIRFGPPLLRPPGSGYTRIAIAVVVALAALVTFFQIVPPDAVIRRYRATPLFDAATSSHFWFYHQWLLLYYPTLWTLFPLAAFAAVAHRPRPALFCLCVFVTAFLALSFGGPKSLNYASFALPFLFVLWGMAVVYVWDGVRRFVTGTTGTALARAGAGTVPLARTALIVAAVGFILLANAATIRTATMLAGITVPPEIPLPRWWDVVETLEPRLDEAAVVVTGSELEALYYLGDYDLMLSKTRLSELPADRAEFDPDPRTGRPVIGARASVERVMNCFSDGLIMVDRFRWRNAAYVDNETADLIVQRAEPIALPPASRVLAFHWTGTNTTQSAACAGLDELVRPERRS